MGPDGLPIGADHAQQKFEMRAQVGAAQWQQHLRVQAHASAADRGAQVGHHVDVGKATNNALVGFLENLHAIATAIIGGLAGGLGGGKGVSELFGTRFDCRDADAYRYGNRAVADAGAELLGALAQRFGKARRIIETGAQQYRKAITRHACRYRTWWQAFADQLADLGDYLIADMHAVGVVDDVGTIGVDRQRAPPALRVAILGEHVVNARLEGRAVQQAGKRVVTAGDHGRGAPRQQLAQPRLARREFRHIHAAKQRQYTERAAIGTRHGTGQQSIGIVVVAGLQLHVIDDQRIAAHLCAREQMAVGARHQTGIHGVTGLLAYQHQTFLGHDQCRQTAVHVFDGGAQNDLEFIAAVIVGAAIAAADLQQHVQILIVFGERAAQIHDLLAIQQFASQYLERRS